jgi:hypothetical protein
MAHKIWVVALGTIVAASPLSATTPEPTPATLPSNEAAGTEYCLRVGPYTGTRLEGVQCRTREEWAEQCVFEELVMTCVDVDKEWAENGVRIETREMR